MFAFLMVFFLATMFELYRT